MDLAVPLAWLVDEAGAAPAPDGFLAGLGGRLLADGLPLAGGALTLAVPHPIVARRAWLWRAETGAVIEALGFAGGPPGAAAGRGWLEGLGPVQEAAVGPAPDGPLLGWAGTRPFGRSPRSPRGRRWRRCSRPISAGAAPPGCGPAPSAAAAARPSTPRCSMPTCAASPRCPRRPRRPR
jgi:hypothetical protein